MNLELLVGGKNLTGLTTELPKPPKCGFIKATAIHKEPSKAGEDDKIGIREFRIDGKVSPDIAYIVAGESFPVQIVNDDVKVSELLLGTNNNAPVGIILRDPDGNVTYSIYDPLTANGVDGYTISKGWMAQIIIGKGTVLELLDYWWPRGFSSRVHKDHKYYLYGELVEQEVDEADVPEEFKRVRNALSAYIDSVTKERMVIFRMKQEKEEGKERWKKRHAICKCLIIVNGQML